jgi:hypothetical protein
VNHVHRIPFARSALEVRLWDVRGSRPIAYLSEHDNPVWSSDGRYLAVFGPGRFKSGAGEMWGDRMATLVYAPLAAAIRDLFPADNEVLSRARPPMLLFVSM